MPLPWPDLNHFLKEHPLPTASSSPLPGPKVTGFQPVHYSGLIALVEVAWPDGRTDREIRYVREGDQRRITPPLRFVGANKSYWLITFIDFETQQKYESQILAAIDRYLGGDDHVG
jgi:hypothetical protein